MLDNRLLLLFASAEEYLIETYCGDDGIFESVYSRKGRSLFVIFKTDNSIENDGFQLQYESFRECTAVY